MGDAIVTGAPSVLWGLAVLAGVMGLGRLLWGLSGFYRDEIGMPGGRFETLDGIRGLLAPAVFVAHAGNDWVMYRTHGDLWAPPSSGYMAFGRMAVWTFFCITAFLFWGKVIDGKLGLAHYFRGRVLRICPLYLVMAFLAGALLLGQTGHVVTAVAPAAQWARLFSFGLFNLGRDHVDPTPSAATAGVMWTLQCEWAFYAVLPLIAFCRDFKRWLILAVVAAALVAPKISPLPTEVGMTFRSPVGSFLIGMLAAYAVRRRPHWLLPLRGPVAALIALAATAASGLLVYNQPMLLVLVILPVFFIVVSGNSVFGLLASRAARTLGAMSYSIYLLHPLVLYTARPLLSRAAHTAHPLVTYWSATLGVGVGVVVLAALAFRFVEKPFIQLERRFRHSHVNVPAAEPTDTVEVTPEILTPA